MNCDTKLILYYGLLGFVSSLIISFVLAFCCYNSFIAFVCTFVLLGVCCYYAFLILTRAGPDQKLKFLYIIVIILGGLAAIFISAMHAKDYLDYSSFARFVIILIIAFGTYALACCEWPFILVRLHIDIHVDEFTGIFVNLGGALLQGVFLSLLFAFLSSKVTESKLLGTLCLRAFGDLFLGTFGGVLIGLYTAFQDSQREKMNASYEETPN